MRRVFSILALACASMVLVGCTAQTTGQAGGGTTNPGSNEVTVNTGGSSSGQVTVGTGNGKSSSWPASVPTLDAGYDFSYAKAGDSYYLGYKVKTSKDVKAIATDLTNLMKNVGWTLPSENVLESSEAIWYTFTNNTSSLTLTVGKDDSENGVYTIAMIMGPKTN